jgi:hypothetical protein
MLVRPDDRTEMNPQKFGEKERSIWLQMIGTISNHCKKMFEKIMAVLGVTGRGILGLILVRMLPILLSILVAVWLFAHPESLIGIALAAALLSIVRAIDAGPL